MNNRQRGFSLVEICVVVALIAILAAVAMSRFGNADATAERTLIRDLVTQLNSAYGIYAAEQGTPPTTFQQFVSNGAVASGQYTIGLRNFSRSPGSCEVSGNRITGCSFKNYDNVIYTLQNNGIITVSANACCGNSLAF